MPSRADQRDFATYLGFFSVLLQIIRLYQFAVWFIFISLLILPLSIAAHLLVYTFYPESYFLSLFSRLYSCIRILLYVLSGLLKRVPFALYGLFRSKFCAIRYISLVYVHSYAVFLAIDMLYRQWKISRIILISGDVEINPGPNTLEFCCWNLNSISAHDFLRISLIEAYNSIYNYDLKGIVETHLDDTVNQERLAMKGYEFIKCNHPSNIKRGGIGLYINDTLPKKERPDIAILPECIVCELHFDRKKYFFVVLYRSPSQEQAKFDNFMNNFELMLSKISAKDPQAVIITGDSNCRSPQWWENDNENDEGKQFEPLTSAPGLYQLISGPTHIIGQSRSCIDLIFTDQPHLFIESGIHPSLHEQCHHQIVHGRLSITNLAPPSYTRKLWFYDRADFLSIRKSVEMFRWKETFEEVTHPDEQVEILNEVLLNICSNFIPNQLKKIKPRQIPWITPLIKRFLRKKNRAFKSFVKKGHPEDLFEGIQNMIAEGSRLIEEAKHAYFAKVGRKLSDPSTGTKMYWSLVNKILNKAKIPEIPLLLQNDIFILDFASKAQIFNDYFILQCTTLDTGSEIPCDLPEKMSQLTEFAISEEKILKIIRNLNSNKAHGWDGISVRMIKICDESLIVPLRLIFENFLHQGIFPEPWKRANAVPVHKKNERN